MFLLLLCISDFHIMFANTFCKKAHRHSKKNHKKLKAYSFRTSVYDICGRQDPLAFDTYELKILLLKTQFFLIRKSGHFPTNEQPGNFYKVLNGILENEKILHRRLNKFSKNAPLKTIDENNRWPTGNMSR